MAVVKNTFEMIAGDEDLPGPLRELAQHARKGLAEGYVKPIKRVFDNTKVSDHFAIIPTLQAPTSLSELEAKLYDLVVKRFLAVFYPPAEYMVTTRISKVEARAPRTTSRPTARCWSTPAGWPSTARKRRTRTPTWCRAAGRAGAHRKRRRQGAADQAAGALHRSHAAERDGRRGQADRRRRAARGHGREGPGHAGHHARAGDRRPDPREVHAARGPRADPHGQGLPADDAAARPGHRGPDQARAHRQLGIPARRDGARPPQARPVHGRDRQDGRAHRAQGQGIRPRHHSRRLRHAEDALPQLRRRGQGELPPLRLHRQHGSDEGCGFSITKIPAGRSLRDRRGRAPSCATRRSARWRASAPRPAGPSRPS